MSGESPRPPEARACDCCGLYTSIDPNTPSFCDRCRRERLHEVKYLYALSDKTRATMFRQHGD